LILSAALALAQAAAATPLPPTGQPAPATATAGSACADGAYRQFDFWVGDWTAYDPGGADVLAKVKVTRSADGCALLEEVSPTKGPASVALIAYDPESTLWRWDGVAGDGRIVSLQGGMQNGEMVLEGDQSGAPGHGLARITWKVQGEIVSEGGERSADSKDWSTWFDWDLRRTR
jgi:hypothetical protein